MKKRLTVAFGLIVIINAGLAAVSAQTKVNVRFKPGTTVGKYNGSIRGERYIDYLMAAKKGQTLRATLRQMAGATAYFNILWSGSLVAIADNARETGSWNGSLPEDGMYVVRVYMAKADRLNRRTSTFQIGFNIEGG